MRCSVYAAPPVVKTEVFARVPDSQRAQENPRKQSGVVRDCFLEGPSFDRDGNLYVTNIPYRQIFKVSPDGEFTVVASYDGEPNGLKIHRDGRIFIADHKQGLMLLDPHSGKVEAFLDRPRGERFKGLNDLVFANNGDLYFTDQGESGLHDPTGRLYRLRVGGRLELLLDNVPTPNGLVLTPNEEILYLAVTRNNAVWRVPLLPDGNLGRVGIFIQLAAWGRTVWRWMPKAILRSAMSGWDRSGYSADWGGRSPRSNPAPGSAQPMPFMAVQIARRSISPKAKPARSSLQSWRCRAKKCIRTCEGQLATDMIGVRPCR